MKNSQKDSLPSSSLSYRFRTNEIWVLEHSILNESKIAKRSAFVNLVLGYKLNSLKQASCEKSWHNDKHLFSTCRDLSSVMSSRITRLLKKSIYWSSSYINSFEVCVMGFWVIDLLFDLFFVDFGSTTFFIQLFCLFYDGTLVKIYRLLHDFIYGLFIFRLPKLF